MKFHIRTTQRIVVIGTSLLLLSLLLVFQSVLAASINIALNFGSLPSVQGWTYNPGVSGAVETNVFSVGGGLLHMDTKNTGVGFNGLGYRYYNAADPTLPFTLTARIRVTDYAANDGVNPYGFSMSVNTGLESFEVGISPLGIRGGPLATFFTTSVDVSQFHDYRMEGTPGVGFEFFIDGISYGSVPSGSVSYNYLEFGDGSAGASSVADIASYSFVQIDNEQPVCSGAIPSVNSLWPPQHQMVPVTILGVTDPDGDPVTVTIDSIYQDEPTNGLGDGDLAPDGQGVGTAYAAIRAERSGTGNGRVYHIGFSASDGQGGSCAGAVLVSVNHNQGKKGQAVDDGSLYDSGASN